MALIHDLPFAEYLASNDLSASMIKHILRSPAHLRDALDTPKAPTPTMQLGSMIHALVLEGDEAFEGRYVPAPRIDRRTKAGKEAHLAAVETAKAAGAELVPADDFERAQAVACAVLNSSAAHLVAHGTAGVRTEVSAFWTDEATGTPQKCRFDALADDEVIIDLKTTADASPGAFARTAANLGYHISAAHYIDGARAHGLSVQAYCLVAVETAPPYGVTTWILDDVAISKGAQLVSKGRARYAECVRDRRWPSYDPIPQILKLPAWALSGD